MSYLHRVLFSLAVCIVVAASARAEPCVLAYPAGQTVFHYDPSQFEVVGPASSKYNPSYALSGQMLWDTTEGRVAYEVYRAPGLTGFQSSSSGESVFQHVGNHTLIVVDGFSPSPRHLSDIYVQFTPQPLSSVVSITVDGSPVSGLRYVIPSLPVTTPIGNGFYSNTIILNVEWFGAREMEIVVYSDRNGNRIFDGNPVFSIIMEDFSVPTENKTWGGIKAIYRSE
jgi:hypothetical protein